MLLLRMAATSNRIALCREEVSGAELNDLRGISNSERVDEALYQDFETALQRKVRTFSVYSGSATASLPERARPESEQSARGWGTLRRSRRVWNVKRLGEGQLENAAGPVQKREAREAKHRDKLAKLVAEVCFPLYERPLESISEQRALVYFTLRHAHDG